MESEKTTRLRRLWWTRKRSRLRACCSTSTHDPTVALKVGAACDEGASATLNGLQLESDRMAAVVEPSVRPIDLRDSLLVQPLLACVRLLLLVQLRSRGPLRPSRSVCLDDVPSRPHQHG